MVIVDVQVQVEQDQEEIIPPPVITEWNLGIMVTGFLSVFITVWRIYQTDTVASHNVTIKSSEATNNPVYELAADKLQPMLINMLFRSIFKHLRFHKVAFKVRWDL